MTPSDPPAPPTPIGTVEAEPGIEEQLMAARPAWQKASPPKAVGAVLPLTPKVGEPSKAKAVDPPCRSARAAALQ